MGRVEADLYSQVETDLNAQTLTAFREIKMDNSEQILAPSAERHVELRRLEWAKDINQNTLTAITDLAEWVEFDAGQVLIEVDSEIDHVYFLITGRLQATLYDSLGKEIQQDTLIRGSVIGLFSIGLSDRSHLHVQATEPSAAIRLTRSNLFQLTAKDPEFQLTMFRLAANIFKRYAMVERSLPKPSVVGVVHYSQASRPLLGGLVRRLRELGEFPCIAGDDEEWKPDGDFPFKLLAGGGRLEDRYNILKDWASHRRLFVDIRSDHPPEAL